MEGDGVCGTVVEALCEGLGLSSNTHMQSHIGTHMSTHTHTHTHSQVHDYAGDTMSRHEMPMRVKLSGTLTRISRTD